MNDLWKTTAKDSKGKNIIVYQCEECGWEWTSRDDLTRCLQCSKGSNDTK